MNSGIGRNDCYAGTHTLFAAFRKIQEKDKQFKIEVVDELLKLQKHDNLLVAYLVELEKKPTNRAMLRAHEHHVSFQFWN